MFYLYLINSDKKCIIYDLSKYTDWYDFNFKKNKKNVFKKTIKTKYKKNLYKKYLSLNIDYLGSIYKKYNTFYKKISTKINYNYKNIFLLNFKFFFEKKIFWERIQFFGFYFPSFFEEIFLRTKDFFS